MIQWLWQEFFLQKNDWKILHNSVGSASNLNLQADQMQQAHLKLSDVIARFNWRGTAAAQTEQSINPQKQKCRNVQKQ